MAELKRGDKVLVEATVIDIKDEGEGRLWLNVHGSAPVKCRMADVKGEVPVPEPRDVHVKATVSISGYTVSNVIDYLESWDELIRGLGYVEFRQIADDDKSVTFWCLFETDEGDDMHARDRAQETMSELTADAGGVEWGYVDALEVPR